MAGTPEERLGLLKACPDAILREALYRRGMLDLIPWDKTAPRERAVEIAQCFDGMPPGYWAGFWKVVEELRREAGPMPSRDDRSPPVPAGPFKLSGLPRVTTELHGREAELALLDECWESEEPHILGFIGESGQGKTVLVHTWLNQFLQDGLRGATCVYVHSFYRQGTGQGGSSDDFLEAALRFLKDPSPSDGKPADKAARLAAILRQYRTLLVLDGVEPLQENVDPAARFQDSGIKALLQELAYGFRGLCVVTSRRSLDDLRGFVEQGFYREQPILPVTEEAGADIIEEAGVSPSEDVAAAARDFAVHGLSMRSLGRFIAAFLDGDASRRREVSELATEQGTLEEILAAFDSRLTDTQRCAMRMVGLFEEPAKLQVVRCLWEFPAVEGVTEPVLDLTPEKWFHLAESLRDLGLLWPRDEEELEVVDAHPRIRGYFGGRLKEENEAGWRECHRRLFRRLAQITPRFPDTLNEMLPLYAAVRHGCQAGLHQEAYVEVYRARILRGKEFYSVKNLGAFGADLGATACFFEEPWRRLASGLSQGDQAWLLNQAAICLRSLGRPTEAVEPMRASRDMCVQQESWTEAAIRGCNLSELELTLGEVAAAVRDAEKSVDFADRSDSAFWPLGSRATLGDALHQSGRRAEARERFREAEAMQAQWQPPYPLLYSLRGVQYCDLLLGQAERAAWQTTLNAECGMQYAERAPVCGEVEQRAATMLKWERENWLLDTALDHLILGRAALYRTILVQSTIDGRQSAVEHLAVAVEGLRTAGQLQELPRGLLSRALLRHVSGDAEGSARDLDEAWEIAQRGPMRLHMADVLLHRARLFRDTAALAEARKLIEQCGYWRRKEELEDAEEAARDW